jgi:hypothetical protein
MNSQHILVKWYLIKYINNFTYTFDELLLKMVLGNIQEY